MTKLPSIESEDFLTYRDQLEWGGNMRDILFDVYRNLLEEHGLEVEFDGETHSFPVVELPGLIPDDGGLTDIKLSDKRIVQEDEDEIKKYTHPFSLRQGDSTNIPSDYIWNGHTWGSIIPDPSESSLELLQTTFYTYATTYGQYKEQIYRDFVENHAFGYEERREIVKQNRSDIQTLGEIQENIIAGSGGSCGLIVNTPDGYQMVFGKASGYTERQEGVYELVPAGFFERTIHTNSYLRKHLIVEICEEIAGVPESSDVLASEEAAHIESLYRNGEIHFETVMCGFNLSNFHIDIGNACLIEDESFYEQYLTNGSTGFEIDELKLIPVTDEEALSDALGSVWSDAQEAQRATAIASLKRINQLIEPEISFSS